jgi:hypothetical protein
LTFLCHSPALLQTPQTSIPKTTSREDEKPRTFTAFFLSLPHPIKFPNKTTQLITRVPFPDRHALKFGSQKINLHLSGKEFEVKESRKLFESEQKY